MRLAEVAVVIRSKNAGPFCVTIDLFFDTPEDYERARNSRLLTPAGVAEVYGVAEDKVKGVYWDDRVLAGKVSVLRWSSSSDPFCADYFGAHQHHPLAAGELDEPTEAAA
ncbi:DUF4387 family protein [Streptomyces rapamycinicus]|uniref:DUF4387 domain-containing protein n=2 Tax=Streptomyces rapamycinicus TaxID=1226757 RepID=A0A0A0N381_STRRN|nr:DUF4387 family protein [Streptomyces rapamycinicus]AGP51752.1 hypothetical protein M271_00565 [Streptomyces rapamycinicus NRRL 5491]MBB4779163.1 hypothetical protein [Streptomyces rapamycinicus]RLV76169.1 hypothetical protein D3C57_143125 [Streptomyces rapamycinicus NRRL 5491]UTP27978.1 DUF4387 domain-containing protein [Streptomyces rapamycinicus NRRL 5491]